MEGTRPDYWDERFDLLGDTCRSSCIFCGAKSLDLLFWSSLRGVPHGHPGHKVVYDYHVMFVCPACGHLQIEQSSHDCWSHDEPWEMYWWYGLSAAEVDPLRKVLRACPTPLDSTCRCPVHQKVEHSFRHLSGTTIHTLDPNELGTFLEVRFVGEGGEGYFEPPPGGKLRQTATPVSTIGGSEREE